MSDWRRFPCPPLQPQSVEGVSHGAGASGAHAGQYGEHWRATQTTTAQPAWVPARGYRASRTSRRPAGTVSHQRGGHGDAMASGGVRRDDLRAAPIAGSGGDAASDSVRQPRLPLRQRQRVHQPPGGGVTGKTASGVHQIAGVSDDGQRAGGREERGGDSQTPRRWSHRGGARRWR
jgi:hypothetical protein